MIIISAQDITDIKRKSVNKPEERKQIIKSALANYVTELHFEEMTPHQLISTFPLLKYVTSEQFLTFLCKAYEHFQIFKDIDLTEPENNGLIPLSIQRNKPPSHKIADIPVHLRCGFYAKDLMTPIYDNTYQQVANCIQATYMATQSAINNDVTYILDAAGHHATYEEYGGYCFINTAVFGALCLQDGLGYKGKIAILDIDYHHGDGTQDLCQLFGQSHDINCVSIHMNPMFDYPKHCGYEFENGKYNTNVIVEPKSDINKYMEKLQIALDKIRQINPYGVVLSIGYDILVDDLDANSMGGMNIKPDDFKLIAKTISSSLYKINKNMKVLLVQEGGYNLDLIPKASYNFVENFKLE